MGNMNITLQFFASLREELGIKKILVDLPREMIIKDLLEYVSENIPELKSLKSKISGSTPTKYIFLLNGNTIDLSDTKIITTGSEISILPPVGGG